MDALTPRVKLLAVIVVMHGLLLIVSDVPVWLVVISALIIGIAAWHLAPDETSHQSNSSERQRPQSHDVTDKTGTDLLAGLPDAIMVVDADGRVVRTNKAFVEVFPQATPGRLLTAAVRNPVLLEAMQRASRGADHIEVEFSLPPPNVRYFNAVILQLRGPKPRPQIVVVCHDVTTAKQIERIRVDFIANASHELRTPLSSLAGFIETLRGPAKDDPAAQERFLGIMQVQAERMKRLIDDLLSLSRVEIDEHVPPSDDVDVVAVIEQVIDGLKPAAELAGVKIRLDAQADLPHVAGSQHELSQVFVNLIDNAIKYGREGKVVDILVRRLSLQNASGAHRPFIRVAVSDHGKGIPQEDLPRLTERFYRVDPERSRKEGGTGLGLAIVKHIVNRHKGRLQITSEQGKGSTFAVVIPAIIESTNP